MGLHLDTQVQPKINDGNKVSDDIHKAVLLSQHLLILNCLQQLSGNLAAMHFLICTIKRQVKTQQFVPELEMTGTKDYIVQGGNTLVRTVESHGHVLSSHGTKVLRHGTECLYYCREA